MDPSISIWYGNNPFIFAASKGQRKTAAIRLLKKPISEIKEEIEWAVDQPYIPPQLCINHFSLKNFTTWWRLTGSCAVWWTSKSLCQLNLFKHNCSAMNSKTIITFNGGSSRTRNYSTLISETAFNICGFIQPVFVERVLLSDDSDCFMLFCFPPQRDMLLGDLKVPIPADIPAHLWSIWVHLVGTLEAAGHSITKQHSGSHVSEQQFDNIYYA